MKKNNIFIKAAALFLCVILFGSLVSCSSKPSGKEEHTRHEEQSKKDDFEQVSQAATATLKRVKLLSNIMADTDIDVTAAIKEPGITNIDSAVNAGAFYLDDQSKSLLLNNGFFVSSGSGHEFFQKYEHNRYSNVANFVTVDSMMHAYHMYFSYLLKSTERNYLSSSLSALSKEMLEVSKKQQAALAGTPWEVAALRNVAFFTVGLALLDENTPIDSTVEGVVNMEISKIIEAQGIGNSALTGVMIDYSQFKPRGYYEGDAGLEKYFRAMMWYGQVGFLHTDEDLDKCALLMSIGLNSDEAAKELWTSIYAVTSFFAGESDDLTYYEYYSAAEAVYGQGVIVDDIKDKNDEWNKFKAMIDDLKSPAINSIPTYDDHDPDTKSTDTNKGFRFMGQRFSIDADIFQNLMYDNVQADSKGRTRMLPDTLDVAAAFGSDVALNILAEQGDTDYAGYNENMQILRKEIEAAGDYTWSSSLYNAWLYTLKPLLAVKGEGYPSFMQNEEWLKKDIEAFASSYAELKHDTVLYAKQAMAEMGGDVIPDWDTRGYVEPEVQVWARFESMADQTADGLKKFNMIEDVDVENLKQLASLANSFKEMSIKELKGEVLTDAEYDIIKYYGGDLEHLWEASLADEGGPLMVANYPAAIITDVATDPNGYCLEIGTGRVDTVTVLVYFDGAYHLCSGSVYSFYQFAQPISDRLTDSSWRQMMGLAQKSDGSYNYNGGIAQPQWTSSYRYRYK